MGRRLPAPALQQVLNDEPEAASTQLGTDREGNARWEVLKCERYDYRADLYSFGVVVWVLLSGGIWDGGDFPLPPCNKYSMMNLKPLLEPRTPTSGRIRTSPGPTSHRLDPRFGRSPSGWMVT